MPTEILINVSPREVRAAVVENGALQDLLIERVSRRGLVGNVYAGRVLRVLPGMQAAFVEIGLERTAFLHASDIVPREPRDKPEAVRDDREIRDLLHEGQQVLVQVLKEPIGSKGARLTTAIAIPSRYLVYMPRGTGFGVSSRIVDTVERERLRADVEQIAARDSGGGGYIVRTAAEGAGPEALRADMLYLNKLWAVITERAAAAAAPALAHADPGLAVRVLRDLVRPGVARVLVDSEQALGQLRDFAQAFMPELAASLECYQGPRPILDLFGVEEEIQKALDKRVGRKSGGYVIFDQTEAMTTVDVNTGGYVGYRSLEETIYRTNLEAAATIARQLRLRNLGGIIIIDFIDMVEAGHQQQVLEALTAALVDDPARPQIAQVSPLGLVEMTRRRNRESLERLLCQPCPSCQGRGNAKRPETVCYEIFREIQRQRHQHRVGELVVLAHQDVVEMLLDEEAGSLAEVEAQTGCSIRLQTEAHCGPEQFDVVVV